MIAEKEKLIQIISPRLNKDRPPFLAFSKAKYYLPNKLEISKIGTFYKNKFINHFDVRTSQNWNCRSYAESYKIIANLYHSKFIKSEGGSIAIGNVYISTSRSNSGNGHVVNMIYFMDENNINYGFLDALGNFETLNRDELNSIRLIVF